MKKLFVLLVSCLFIVSCNCGVKETIYKVEFIDGTYQLVVGYEVGTSASYYNVRSIHNNSIFNRDQVKGVYPLEIYKQ